MLRLMIGVVLSMSLWWAGPASSAPRVAVTIAPIHSLVSGVMDGIGSPSLILAANQSPHHAALAPSQVATVENSDLLIWVGPGLETGLRRAVAGRPPVSVLELSEIDTPLLLPFRKAGPDARVGHESHDHGHDHHAAIDPHIWLSADVAVWIVEVVTDQLVRMDAANADRYRGNAAILSERLQQWQETASDNLAPFSGLPFVVFHDAFQYFEHSFGLNAVASVKANPERSVGARRLGVLRRGLRDDNVVCLFSEPQFKPEVVDVVLEGGTTRHGVLDPVGAGLASGPEMWFQLMDGLIASFVDCMSNAERG